MIYDSIRIIRSGMNGVDGLRTVHRVSATKEQVIAGSLPAHALMRLLLSRRTTGYCDSSQKRHPAQREQPSVFFSFNHVFPSV